MTLQRLDPAKLGLLLKDELQDLAAAQARLAHERRALQGDAVSAKRYLKQVRAAQRMDDDLDDLDIF